MTDLNKIVSEIINNRQKILDDFAKAYLAENYSDGDIRNLVLNESFPEMNLFEQDVGPGHFRWWFEKKVT